MKKIFLIVIGILIIGFGLIIFFSGNQKQEDPKILTELVDKGNVNGKREFLFTITNVGENKAKLEFPTWLEYNVAIENLDNKEIPSGELIIEDLDLNENNKDGRMLVLEPNEKVNYRLLISKIPNNKRYCSTINPSTNCGRGVFLYKKERAFPRQLQITKSVSCCNIILMKKFFYVQFNYRAILMIFKRVRYLCV